MTMPAALTDLNRLGGLTWLERTRGTLTAAEKRHLMRVTMAETREFAKGAIKVVRGRPMSIDISLPVRPDSALARDAEQACLAAGAHIAGHGFRSWLFGSVLAGLDGVALDPELFYVSALLHDHGLQTVVANEDFTLRSGHIAQACLERHDRHADCDAVRDAIAIHCQPGANVAADGPLGSYLQAGAVADIVGVRVWDLPKSLTDDVLGRHDRTGFLPEIRRLIGREAKAVPDGRFAVLRRSGFAAATHASLLR